MGDGPACAEQCVIPLSAALSSSECFLRQVGYKRMLYMCLHAETVLDLIEKPLRCVPG
jgi:hypothetical protein